MPSKTDFKTLPISYIIGHLSAFFTVDDWSFLMQSGVGIDARYDPIKKEIKTRGALCVSILELLLTGENFPLQQRILERANRRYHVNQRDHLSNKGVIQALAQKTNNPLKLLEKWKSSECSFGLMEAISAIPDPIREDYPRPKEPADNALYARIGTIESQERGLVLDRLVGQPLNTIQVDALAGFIFETLTDKDEQVRKKALFVWRPLAYQLSGAGIDINEIIDRLWIQIKQINSEFTSELIELLNMCIFRLEEKQGLQLFLEHLCYVLYSDEIPFEPYLLHKEIPRIADRLKIVRALLPRLSNEHKQYLVSTTNDKMDNPRSRAYQNAVRVIGCIEPYLNDRLSNNLLTSFIQVSHHIIKESASRGVLLIVHQLNSFYPS